MLPRVLVMGSDVHTAVLLGALQPLAAKLHCVVPPDRPFGRPRVMTPCEAKRFCVDRGIPTSPGPQSAPIAGAEEWAPIIDLARGFDVAVVFSFGYKLPSAVVAAPARGTINIHPSLLPRYRGAAPIQHALLNDDQETGVCIIEVHPERFDVGDILARKTHAIRDSHTLASLSKELAEVGSSLVVDLLRGDTLEQRRTHLLHQTDVQGIVPSKAPKLGQEHRIASWSKPARCIFSQSRAMNGVSSALQGRKLFLSDVEPPNLSLSLPLGLPDFVHSPGDAVFANMRVNVMCGDGKWLPFARLQMEGKKLVEARDFARGYMVGGREKIRLD